MLARARPSSPSFDPMSRLYRTLAHLVHRHVLRSRTITAQIPQYDLQLSVSPADVIGRHLYKYRRYEPILAQTLETQLDWSSPAVMVDVGANIGWYSLLVSRLSRGACRVFAFEPDPRNFALLESNLALNDTRNVKAFNLALGESAATLQLHRYDHDNAGRHSLLELHDGASVPVQVVSLDTLWSERRLPDGPIRLLKMDIEGYEVIALRGAHSVLSRCEWVLIEHSPAYLEKSGFGIDALIDLMHAAGFSPFEPLGDRIAPIDPAVLRTDPAQRDVLWRTFANLCSPSH